MADGVPYGPAVDPADTLWRIISPMAAAVWLPYGALSSAAFAAAVFSTDIARLTTEVESLARWPAGSGIVEFGCGRARDLGFHAHHEPELGNAAHANVYSSFTNNERKRQARKLAAMCRLIVSPIE